MADSSLAHAQPRLAALRRRIDALRPSTAWRVGTSVLYSGIIAVIVVGAAALLLGVKPSSPGVASVSSIEAGDCVTVSGDQVTRADCETGDLTFAVAQKVAAKTACSLPSYARVESGGSTLCVVPNLALDSCYQVPPNSTAASTDIKAVTCPTSLGSSTANVVKVTERAVGGPLNCRGTSALNYSEPRQISYCIAPVS